MTERGWWFLSLVAGVALVALLGAHMAVQHYGAALRALGWIQGPPARSFAAVTARGRILGWAVLYGLLLLFALYHGLYGLRGILLEVWPRAARVITAVLVIAGIAMAVFGTTTIMRAIGGS
ncbi:MAG TPA: hypothetical protein VGX75_00010 [bacterium]|nr:hypothetical protein [bacterium]